MGKIVNKRELSDIVGVSTVTLDTWARKGMPYETLPLKTGVKKQFDTVEVIKWRCQQVTATGDGSDRERFEKARADEMEARALAAKLKAAEVSKTFVRAEEVKILIDTLLATMRDGLLALPDRLAERIAGQRATAVRQLLEQEVKIIANDIKRQVKDV